MRRSGVWQGEGVLPGEGRPVLLIPGFLAGDGSLEQKTVQLIDAANANGGRDNISVLLAHASSGSRKRGLISRWLGQ